MEITAHYEQIQEKIIERLTLANSKIEVAVAWFTNRSLMERLIQKLAEEVEVEVIILNDRINFRPRAVDFERFISGGGKLRLGNSGKRLHHKICILDNNEVLTGSYNWTYFAENYNHENIIVSRGNPTLLETYRSAYSKVRLESIQIENLGKYHLMFPPETPVLLTGRSTDEESMFQILEDPESSDSPDLFNNINIENLTSGSGSALKEIYVKQQSPSFIKVITDKSSALKSLVERFHNWDSLSLQHYSRQLDLGAISLNNNMLWTMEKIRALEFTEVQKNDIFQYGRFEDVDRFLLEGSEFLNWNFICMNEHITWTISLLHLHKNHINWENLAGRSSFVWHENDIEIFSTFFKNWGSISRSSNVNWTSELIERYQASIDWYNLSKNPSIVWNLELLDKFQWRLDFRQLSANTGSFWTAAIIEHFELKWNWNDLSSNVAVCWDKELIGKYVRKLDREKLVVNPGIKWTAEMLTEFSEWLQAPTLNYGNGWGSLSVTDGNWKSVSVLTQFENKIHWRFIADNRKINWPEFLGSELRSHLFKYYTPKNTIYVGIVGLAQNPTFPWDRNLIVENRELIDRDASVWQESSKNAGFFMSKNFVVEFADKLDFCALSWKKSLEWSEELLGIFPDKDWSWGSISQNDGFPWTDSMLDNYSDKLSWDEIAKNKGVFDGVLKSKINPVVISLLMAEKQ